MNPMYVCICHGVTDKKIKASVEEGATSMRQLSKELGVASQCGKCAKVTRQILNETLLALAEDAMKVA